MTKRNSNSNTNYKALVELARSIIVQDEFTFSDNTPLEYKQAARLINAWRNKARAALLKSKS